MANPTDFPPVSGAAAALYYWDGFNWQKWQGTLPGYTPTNPLAVISTNGDKLFGIESRILQRVTIASAPAGVNQVTAYTVSAGKIAIIAGLSGVDNTSNPTRVRLSVASAVSELFMVDVAGAGAQIIVPWTGAVYIAAGEVARVTFTGVTVGDQLVVDVNGYVMDAT